MRSTKGSLTHSQVNLLAKIRSGNQASPQGSPITKLNLHKKSSILTQNSNFISSPNRFSIQVSSPPRTGNASLFTGGTIKHKDSLFSERNANLLNLQVLPKTSRFGNCVNNIEKPEGPIKRPYSYRQQFMRQRESSPDIKQKFHQLSPPVRRRPTQTSIFKVNKPMVSIGRQSSRSSSSSSESSSSSSSFSNGKCSGKKQVSYKIGTNKQPLMKSSQQLGHWVQPRPSLAPQNFLFSPQNHKNFRAQRSYKRATICTNAMEFLPFNSPTAKLDNKKVIEPKGRISILKNMQIKSPKQESYKGKEKSISEDDLGESQSLSIEEKLKEPELKNGSGTKLQ